MDDYPEYVFGCSQAQQYVWMKHHYPEIYARIKERVAAGQWEPIGSMWVETDCNIPSGESLVRQILNGKQFFSEEFGYDTRDAWIPDVFGYSAALPQILRSAGSITSSPRRSPGTRPTSFRTTPSTGKGIDGTRVLHPLPPGRHLQRPHGRWRRCCTTCAISGSMAYSDRSLYVYGYGDGGRRTDHRNAGAHAPVGGLRRAAPDAARARSIDFLREAEEASHDLPVWVGELYLELHRGTYTTQARNKRNNREASCCCAMPSSSMR